MTGHATLEIVAGIQEALREDGLQITWQGLVTHHPAGHRFITRCPKNKIPFILHISDADIDICYTNGDVVAKFDLNDPNSLTQISDYIKNADTKEFITRISGTWLHRAISRKEYEEVLKDWDSQ